MRGTLLILHASKALHAHLRASGVPCRAVRAAGARSSYTLTVTDALRGSRTPRILAHVACRHGLHPLRRRDGRAARCTDVPVPGASGWRLRVRHHERIMGPSGFLSIDPDGEGTAPCGMWMLYKAASFEQPRERFEKKEALVAAEMARDMTRNWSKRNRRMSDQLFRKESDSAERRPFEWCRAFEIRWDRIGVAKKA